MTKLGVGVIGCGYWGPNLVRNFQRHPESHVVTVCDREIERASRVASEYRVPTVCDQAEDVFANPEVSLVVVATPTFTHHALAKSAIEGGKHVLVMKPLTGRLDHAEELCAMAERQGVLLAVDHTFLFTGAVRKMRQLIVDGAIGQIYYFDSVRINLGLIQTDVNVIWDLAPHDVSILDYLVRNEPVQVQAIGAAHGGSPTENLAYLNVRYDDSLLGHVHVNWLAPAKIRRTIVGGSKRMMVYDDMEPSEKLRVYDKGFTTEQPGSENGYKLLISYRSGDMHAPKLDASEALAVEVDNVVGAIGGRNDLTADGVAGLRVVRILEGAQRSLELGGLPVRLDSNALAER
jgi:predicted dehydrogenase